MASREGGAEAGVGGSVEHHVNRSTQLTGFNWQDFPEIKQPIVLQVLSSVT